MLLQLQHEDTANQLQIFPVLENLNFTFSTKEDAVPVQRNMYVYIYF